MVDWGDYDYFDSSPCPQCSSDPCECDIDVCQHCGGYFTWTADLRKTWRKHWNPSEKDRQPQRCRRCLVDDTWIENGL